VHDTNPVLSSVLLSWNRPHMLYRTLRSYREATRSAAELIVVDNGSQRETRTLIESAESVGLIDAAIFLPTNQGGLALNYPTPLLRGSYVHYSENDIEYRPHWDTALLAKFMAFPSLGQLSPFAPKPEVHIGEVWVEHRGQLASSSGQEVFATNAGVGTTCIIRRQVLDRGVRWTNIESGEWRWPNDANFSSQVRRSGFAVAWNDSYVATNLGHNISELEGNLPYYLAGYAAKRWVGIRGFERRLRNAGYELARGEDGQVLSIRRLPEYEC
jgi:glycosyltransferase involved in cell wall biosynthesis